MNLQKAVLAAWAKIQGMLSGTIVMLPNLVLALIVFGLFWWAGKGFRMLVKRLTRRHRQARNLGLALGRLSQGVTILIGLFVALSIIIPTFKAGDLVQLLGISGVAVGFAFRDILQNFLAGILILLTEPFELDDQIVFKGYEGTVENIQTRATTIRTYDGRRVVIPNAELFTNSVIVNTAFEKRRLEYDVGIGYGDDIDRAKQLILEAMWGVNGVLRDPPPDVLTMELAESTVNIRARWWIQPPRRADALDMRDKCERLCRRARAVPTDVTSEEAVQQLAQRAVNTFGRLDVLINNAAVTLFARFEDAPSHVYRRVIETNLFGYIHGARAALPYFREQGSGILINVDSAVGAAGQPYTSAYVATKFAIRGLSSCLRMELNLDDASDIHVCTVMPATIDTPLFQNAANYSGRQPKAMNPVYKPERVAEAIVGLLKKPQREVIVGAAGHLMVAQSSLAPAMYERMMAKQVHKDHFEDKPAPPTDGNLFEPIEERKGISGDWRQTGEIAQEVGRMVKGVAEDIGMPKP